MSLSAARLSLRHAGPSVRALSTSARVEAAKKPVKGKGKAAAAPKAVKAKEDNALPLDEAIRVLRALEIASPHSAFNMEVSTKHNKPNAPPLRGRISLPHDPRRIADTIVVFAEADSPAANAAREAGAHIVGGQDLFPKILGGEIVPTKCLATAGMMPLVSQSLARFLGPKGLMPNIKRGTVGEGVELGRLVEEAGGSIEWKANKLGTVKTPVGRMTFAAADITQNVRLFMDHIREQSVKLSNSESALARVNKAGKLTRVRIETTQGPSIEIKDVL
jgi:large subunit ribosomal protein L1